VDVADLALATFAADTDFPVAFAPQVYENAISGFWPCLGRKNILLPDFVFG